MRRWLAVLAFVAACGGGAETAAPRGGIDEVVVVMRGDEPLPFDPRGGRLTIVSRELARVLGHHVTLELEPALSPVYRASLEESVIASLEGLTQDLVALEKESPEIFAATARLERIVCRYDAVAKESRGKVVEDGRTIEVFAPPDRYPILARGVVSRALDDAFVEGADARWGDVEPERVPPAEHGAYFAYLTRTRPGYGYLYVGKRAKGRDHDDVRLELVGKVVRLHPLLTPGSEVEAAARRFLLDHATFVGAPDGKRDPRRVQEYVAWLSTRAGTLPESDRLALAKVLFERSPVLPGFDGFAFGMSIVDAWARSGHPFDPPAKTKLFETVVCPARASTDANPDVRYGCSAFFARALRDEQEQKRLAEAVLARRDPLLVDAVVMNLGYGDGARALAFVERLSADDALFRRGVRVLLDDLARRDDVQKALDDVALRWWRDHPTRRGLAVYLLARRWAHLHPHYADNQWTRIVPELGGPLSREVYAAYLEQGPRAVELAPSLWPALAKGSFRAELLARALPRLLERDRQARTSRTPAMLAAVRGRLCAERDAVGLAAVRAEVVRWTREHPDDAAQLANAAADLLVEKCPKSVP